MNLQPHNEEVLKEMIITAKEIKADVLILKANTIKKKIQASWRTVFNKVI